MSEQMADRQTLIKTCELCPRQCHTDRVISNGYCGESERVRVARASFHRWEEPCISGVLGSGTVFFSGCSLKCVFCQNQKISVGGKGKILSVIQLSELFLRLQNNGAENINLVTPTHFTPQIARALQIAKSKGLVIPVVYNTSGYERVETLRLLEGLVDIYLPDLKYYNSQLKVESILKPEQPLVYVDVKGNEAGLKNTAPREAQEILKYVLENREKKIGVITPFANQKDCIQQTLEEHGIKDVSCGTVHAFQGDEKDIILFSTALTDQTSEKTYHWLKNNRELINVATSRAREKLVLFSSTKNLERLHDETERDDMYELARYVSHKGRCQVTPDEVHSRALGIKPYSTQTEEDFLVSLNHALGNILNNNRRCAVRREVAISQVFQDNITGEGLFYNGRFDFVIYEREYGGRELPILAIELDGKEHQEEELVKQRDRQKTNICRQHGFELIRVENSYARRYYYIKGILEEYFRKVR